MVQPLRQRVINQFVVKIAVPGVRMRKLVRALEEKLIGDQFAPVGHWVVKRDVDIAYVPVQPHGVPPVVHALVGDIDHVDARRMAKLHIGARVSRADRLAVHQRARRGEGRVRAAARGQGFARRGLRVVHAVFDHVIV